MNTCRSSFPQGFTALAGLCIFLALAVFKADGQTTWALRNSPPAGGELLWSVTDGNAGMVAVGGNGRALHSDDGKTWTVSASGTTVWLVSVTFGNGRYIAVGDNGTILSSIDGTTWSRIPQPGTAARLNNVLYANHRFVAVGEGGVIVISDAGDQWAATSSGVSGWLHGLAYGGSYWIATGEAGAITISKDGVSWKTQSTPLTRNLAPNLEAVAYVTSVQYNQYGGFSNTIINRFLAVGQNGVGIVCEINDTFTYSDPTGTSFTTDFTLTGTNVRLGSLAVYNNVFIATGDNGTVITAKSERGPWTKLDLGTTKLLNASGFGRSSLFLVGEGETIYQSEPIFPSRLSNISTRGQVGAGANVMIAGTIVSGTKAKNYLVRAVGPQLASYGVTGVLPDPVLTIYDAQGRIIATNTGWGTNLNPTSILDAARKVGAFDLPINSKDSALLMTLNPGIYTFIASSANNTGGVGLVEAYDTDALGSDGTRAINISTRALVGTDDKIMIAGFVIQGPSSRTLLIRGVGPTLRNYNVPGTLDDPVVKVIQSDGTIIATNDNWSDPTTVFGHDVTSDEIRGATAQVGAFPLAESSKDAAILITLAPGNYTVHVTGKNSTTGVALVEAYEVQSSN